MDAREIAKAAQAFDRVVKQVESVTGRIDRATRSPLARIDQSINGSLGRWQAAVDRAIQQNQTSFERFQQATAGLDRHQFNRVSRILDGWQSQDFARKAKVAGSPLERFVAWVNLRRRPDPFELYLRRAHEHPAVARTGGGRRLWFEAWRRAALLAVADGHMFRRLRAAAHGVSPPRRRHAAPRPRQQIVIRHRFEQRLRHTIYTHGPTPGSLSSCPVHGDLPQAPPG